MRYAFGYEGEIDGEWGPLMEEAYLRVFPDAANRGTRKTDMDALWAADIEFQRTHQSASPRYVSTRTGERVYQANLANYYIAGIDRDAWLSSRGISVGLLPVVWELEKSVGTPGSGLGWAILGMVGVLTGAAFLRRNRR